MHGYTLFNHKFSLYFVFYCFVCDKLINKWIISQMLNFTVGAVEGDVGSDSAFQIDMGNPKNEIYIMTLNGTSEREQCQLKFKPFFNKGF